MGGKSYVFRLTESISEELKQMNSNVHISTLCPGPVDTNFNKNAGVKFPIKGLTSDYVAKYGVDKCLKNKLIIIPGFFVKMGAFFNKFVPYKLLLKIMYRIQKQKGSE